MKKLSPRILSRDKEIEVIVHIDSEQKELCKRAFEFFLDEFNKNSSADSAWDTEEEFKVNVHIKTKEDKFSNKKTYDVYITPKEHP